MRSTLTINFIGIIDSGGERMPTASDCYHSVVVYGSLERQINK